MYKWNKIYTFFPNTQPDKLLKRDIAVFLIRQDFLLIYQSLKTPYYNLSGLSRIDNRINIASFGSPERM